MFAGPITLTYVKCICIYLIFSLLDILFFSFSLMDADFAVATVLISFGAVLGKTSPVQLLLMATLEVVFYNISLYIGSRIFEVHGVTYTNDEIHRLG